ncbi:MAG: phosphate transport system substrate-binding protein [Methanofollis sp.]|nr:phosphate transport system substrate-binding protein [Methanofollis sp.]
MFENLTKNQEAVSPIVATLVLIVVAVVGAVAVGTIMGTFSDDVGSKVNSDDVSSAVGPAGEVLIGGSTTVQPVSELIAKAFMADHPGSRVVVQGGGSDVGITSAKMGLVDIGAASKEVSDPELEVTQIGGSAVVVIASSDVTATGVTRTDLETAITTNDYTAITGAHAFVQRADGSGTEETFAKWVTDGDEKSLDAYETESATGNAGVLAAVKSHDDYIGFVDAGYALTDDELGDTFNVLTVDGKTASEKTILESLKGTDDSSSSSYVSALTRPLNYMTKGTPSQTVQSFIDFTRSPGAIELFHDAGMYSILEFS